MMIGKSFYEQLRALQKEIDLERRKSALEVTNSESQSQQNQVEMKLTETKLQEFRDEITQLKETLEQKSNESNDLSMQLQASQVCHLLKLVEHLVD
jgi:predicted RNase H-like nuclease (RuvC/YqgF family)